MKQRFTVFLLFTLSLWAADFWQTKAFTEWSTKDVQKMLNTSPWAKRISLSANGPTPLDVGGTAAGNSGVEPGAPPPISEGGGGGRGGRGGRGGGGGGGPAPGGGASLIVARWDSALPVKQALARLKYGAETATSPEAKKALDQQETNYVIVVSGPLRPLLRGDAEAVKKAVIEATSLSAKGKAPLKPTDVQFLAAKGAAEARFLFPRSAPFTLDDKEVDFSTKLGELSLKYKFRLKDMVFNGKLEL